MKSPVYSLIGRVSNITGGTGWHRVYLIDSAIRYFGDWWMIGTKKTAHWIPYVLPIDPDNVDITNQYILVGVQGGVISIILFLYIMVKCFGAIGSSTKYYENKSSWMAKFVWSLGVSLFTYVVSFISVSMFDFIEIYFYMLVSFISIACVHEVNNDTEIVSESSDYCAWYN
jgi:O-antigen ligase